MAGRSSIKEIKAGDDLLKTLTADYFNSIRNAILELSKDRARPRLSSEVPGDSRRHPFQVYPVGWTSSAHTSVKVQVAWGTVCQDDSATNEFAFTDRDTIFTLTTDSKMWLDFSFDEDGVILTGELKSGTAGWTGYPDKYSHVGSSTWNRWYHPIAEIRAARTGKLASGENDLGEYPVIASNKVIAQLTHTHLVTQKQCVGSNVGWVLTPGPGKMTA